jgi:glycosyltransferase involved in cell wall biosynthesis
MTRLAPENAEFAIVSFEGPDEYSRAGGLATRVRDMAEALAAEGFRTHLFFVGDPALPGVEERGNLVLHRWCQWISAYHPGGVYDGERGKIEDMTGSLPAHLIESVALPAAEAGKVAVLMTEDWQTTGVAMQTSRIAAGWGLLRHIIPVWTANNIFGFHGIDWPALRSAATPMTVSKYMKHEMADWGLDPLVVPNGISPASIVTPPAAGVRKLRASFGGELALFKIGRFTPDKRWLMALEAVAILKYHGVRARLLIRGDRSPYGRELLDRARGGGLQVEDLSERYEKPEELGAAIAARPEADVLNLTSFLPDSLVPVIYAAADGVLANSGHEPFGLVGLEVMGAGGLAVVGSTGEEYAEPDRNAIAIDTDDPREIVVELQRLQRDPEAIKRMKKQGKITAKAYVWPAVLNLLFAKLEYVALARGVEVRG